MIRGMHSFLPGHFISFKEEEEEEEEEEVEEEVEEGGETKRAQLRMEG